MPNPPDESSPRGAWVGPTLEAKAPGLMHGFAVHVAAAAATFSVCAAVPIAGLLAWVTIVNDMGGPLFLPMTVVAICVAAAGVTAVLAAAGLACDVVRSTLRVPFWCWPPPALAIVAVATWLVLRAQPRPEIRQMAPWIAPAAGLLAAGALAMHLAAIQAGWFLPRLALRAFRWARERVSRARQP